MPKKDQSKLPVLNMMMLGSGGVGKSAITVRYVQKMFTEEYDPTIEDSYRKEIDYEGKTYQLEILDTAGADQFTALKDTYLKKGDGFVMVYSIDSRSSFDELEGIIQEVLRVKDLDQIPMMIVGNKCDLESHKRIISTEEGKILSSRYPGSEFLESSAKSNENIEEIYLTLLKNLLKERAAIESSDTTKCACSIL